MAGRVASKVALVTGAARGQGRAHAVRLAEEGADIIAVDICDRIDSVPYSLATAQELAETAALVEQHDRRVLSQPTDVRDLAALEEVVRRGVEALGRLDIVVANAGIHSSGMIWELSPRAWQDVLDVNLTGVWNTVRAAVRPMIDAGNGGAVIMTGSTGAVRGFPAQSHYTAAKTAIVGLMRSLLNELGPYGIRVNVIHPTAVDTMMVHNPATYRWFAGEGGAEPTREDVSEAFRSMHALPGDWVDPRDIANAALFLASDEARYVTGTEMRVDMGFCEKQ
jgi:SDR family mycofactocin-dependent oxidoreductase